MARKAEDSRITAAKALVKKKLEEGLIPAAVHPVGPRELWGQHQEFHAFWTYNKFCDYLSAQRCRIRSNDKQGDRDFGAFQHDRAIFPVKMVGEYGRPRWRGSDAERLLKIDIDQGRHKTMKPKEMFEHCPENLPFGLKCYRDHIHQEIKSQKFYSYIKHQQQKKEDKTAATISNINKSNK